MCERYGRLLIVMAITALSPVERLLHGHEYAFGEVIYPTRREELPVKDLAILGQLAAERWVVHKFQRVAEEAIIVWV